jgi:hypothetical protein
MSQARPEKITLDQVLKLVGQLSPEDQGELRRKLDVSWAEQWDKVASRIRERCKSLPPLSEAEISAEVKAVRQARKARRAEGSH